MTSACKGIFLWRGSLTSATSGRPRDWKESWELQSRRLGPRSAVPLEGPEGVRVVRLLFSGVTMLAGRREGNGEMINGGTVVTKTFSLDTAGGWCHFLHLHLCAVMNVSIITHSVCQSFAYDYFSYSKKNCTGFLTNLESMHHRLLWSSYLSPAIDINFLLWLVKNSSIDCTGQQTSIHYYITRVVFISVLSAVTCFKFYYHIFIFETWANATKY